MGSLLTPCWRYPDMTGAPFAQHREAR